jgi:hypothetical protein
MKQAGNGLMSATLNDMQDWVEYIPDATEEEKQLAFNFLVKNDALDVARMLDL